MSGNYHQIIDTWDENDLLNLPSAETNEYEYKSSKIAKASKYNEKLKEDIQIAACAFWNSGGGVFIAGVDDNGIIDGGIPSHMKNTKLIDWVDQILLSVQPIGIYKSIVISPQIPQSLINQNHVVLVIGFGESLNPPHMAPDNKYYVRAGAHSLPAGHYIVEAVRTRRSLRQPMLKGLLREHHNKYGVLELVVLCINYEPALNVTISFDPLPQFMKGNPSQTVSFLVPFINNEYPFQMDIATHHTIDDWFGKSPIKLILEYSDAGGRTFSEQQTLDIRRSISHLRMTHTPFDAPENFLKTIANEITRLRQALYEFGKPRDSNPEE